MKIVVKKNIFIRTNTIKKERQSIWFLHGFGDSGLAYLDIFKTPLNYHYNIYIVDLPGFGASPINLEKSSMKDHAGILAEIMTDESSSLEKVNIVAHSISSLIGTWICNSLKEKINYYFNVEGNLTEADSYFSNKPLQFSSAIAFKDSFQDEVFNMAIKEDIYKKYFCSLNFADPNGMMNWSKSSAEYIHNNRCGFEFEQLTCNKLYIWGDVDTPKQTVDFIETNNIPNKLYPGVGHWHMHENSIVFYSDIYQMLLLSNNK